MNHIFRTVVERLQCNYKTCWLLPPEDNKRGGGGGRTKSVKILHGIYYKGRCVCMDKGNVNKRAFIPSDVRPAALNHVHVSENYKFALNFKTFPTPDGRCVCRFGWQRAPPSNDDNATDIAGP